MSNTDLAFWALAATAVVGGWRVFRTASMVRASFLLLLSFIAVGLIMLLLSASYIGAATVFMMAVEMTVMALFMVMFMMNPAGLNPMSMVHQHRFAIGAGVVAFAGLAAAVLASDFPSNAVAEHTPVVRNLGFELLGDSMLIFESAGVALLATMVGTVILSSRSGRHGPADEGSRPPPLSSGGPPAGPAADEHAARDAHAAHDAAADAHAAHDAHRAHR
ncbi:MAG: NADH-quinone oxidoreductase subunit J [Burkholderiaceae bacterium]|nr:NADH-quinone oxidoreductase subunit J [Burkholderiaceae bacterium]